MLWEGVPTLSDSDAKSSSKNNQGGSGKGGSGRGKRASGGDVGNALRAAYRETLQEQIPPDLLDLLGKLD